MEESNNMVELRGVLAGRPEVSHTSRGEEFYTFPLEVKRLSGASDVINVVARRELLSDLETEEKERVSVRGELRSFNNKSGSGSKLIITVFARNIGFTDEEDSNSVYLRGTLCKPPNLRSTPMGREICDLMVAVNRKYGRSDYLPCIAWGKLARSASQWGVGTEIALTGRIQSRKYIKAEEGNVTEKTAFEVSAIALEEAGHRDLPEST